MLTIVFAILIAALVIAALPSVVAGFLWMLLAIADRRHP